MAAGFDAIDGQGWAHYVGARYPKSRHFGKGIDRPAAVDQRQVNLA
jgi:hypothetical protein